MVHGDNEDSRWNNADLGWRARGLPGASDDGRLGRHGWARALPPLWDVSSDCAGVATSWPWREAHHAETAGVALAQRTVGQALEPRFSNALAHMGLSAAAEAFRSCRRHARRVSRLRAAARLGDLRSSRGGIRPADGLFPRPRAGRDRRAIGDRATTRLWTRCPRLALGPADRSGTGFCAFSSLVRDASDGSFFARSCGLKGHS